VSNLDLVRRAWSADRISGACLVPYIAWTAFATALNAAIVRRNPDPAAAAAPSSTSKTGVRCASKPSSTTPATCAATAC
jgi:TspO/MBR family